MAAVVKAVPHPTKDQVAGPDLRYVPVPAEGESEVSVPEVPSTAPEHARIAEEQFIGSVGTIHLFSVNGVRILTPDSCKLDYDQRQDIVSMVRQTGMRKVMIADTMLTDEIKDLIVALDKLGVEVYFYDHHDDRSRRAPFSRNHTRIQHLLGDRYKFCTREDKPTIADMIGEGTLRDKEIDLVIAAPADADCVVAALRGAGLDMARIPDPVRMYTNDVLAAIDSPNSVHGRSVRQFAIEASRTAAPRAKGEHTDCLPRWSYFARQIPAFSDPIERTRLQIALALCARDGTFDGEGGARLNQLTSLLEMRHAVLATIALNYYDPDPEVQNIMRINLCGVRGHEQIPFDEVFPPGTAERDLAEKLLAPDAISGDDLRIAIQRGKEKDNFPKDLVLIAALPSARESTGVNTFICCTGHYLNHEDGRGIDIRKVAEEAKVDIRSSFGARGYFDISNLAEILPVLRRHMQELDSRLARVAQEKEDRRWSVRPRDPALADD